MFYNYRPDGLSEKGMGQHTSEPWAVERTHDIDAIAWVGQFAVLPVDHATKVVRGNTEDDARRIVACVNACAGMPTEQLEASPLGGVLNGVAGLIAQRYQLLEERNRVGLAIDAAIRDGVVPDEHPLRSRLEMLANHRQREHELRAEEMIKDKTPPRLTVISGDRAA